MSDNMSMRIKFVDVRDKVIAAWHGTVSVVIDILGLGEEIAVVYRGHSLEDKVWMSIFLIIMAVGLGTIASYTYIIASILFGAMFA